MDWFINKEEELYTEDNSNSLSYDPTFDIENIFNKQNSFGDYEVKIEDFVLDKSNTNKNSKLPSSDYRIFETIRKDTIKENNTDTNTNTSSISEKKKDGKQRGGKVVKSKEKNLKKEDLARHPFLVSKADLSKKEKTGKPGWQENSPLPAKLSISQINNNSTASIDENPESLNKSFDSGSKQNTKIDTCVNKNIPNKLSKSPDDFTSIDNYFINEENVMERASVIADCDSLINNNSYSIYDYNEKNFENGKLFDNRVGMTMKSQNCKECINNMSYNLCNMNSNLTYYQTLQHLSISERMKIKREKTKMLLEKKTKRENFSNISGNDINSAEFNSPCAESNPSLCENGSYNQNKSESNVNVNLNDESSNSFSNLNTNGAGFSNNNKLTKKELKMLRNRISAQRSRDRKKKEMDELKVISQNLFNENNYLKKVLENKEKEISHFKEKFKLICKNCDNIIKSSKINKENSVNATNNSQIKTQSSRQRYSLVDDSRRNFSNSLKYSLMTGFLVVVCLIGTLAWQSITSSNDSNSLFSSDFNPTGRKLFTKNENVENSNPINSDLTDVNSNLNDTSTGIILYQNPKSTLISENEISNNNNNLPEFKSDKTQSINSDFPPAVKKHKNIFEVSKDFEKYKEIHKKSTVSTISNSKENNSISGEKDFREEDEDEMIDVNLPINFELSLLEKKRFEFFLKMQKRRNLNSNTIVSNQGFLRKEKEIANEKNNICVNTDDLSWSIQEEIGLHDDDDDSNEGLEKKNSISQFEKYSNHRGIILKANNNFNYNLDNNLSRIINQVVPVNDNRFNYESSLLKQNIKSMYCRDFMTTNEENGEIFKNLFEKLKMKESEENMKYFNYDKK